jgi:hypothetical protein
MGDHRPGRDAAFDPRQVRRQRATAGPPLGGSALAQFRIPLLRLGICFGDRLLEWV